MEPKDKPDTIEDAPPAEDEGEFVEDILEEEPQLDADGTPQPPKPEAEPAAPAAPAPKPGAEAPPRGAAAAEGPDAAAPRGSAADKAAPAADAPKTTDASPLVFEADGQSWQVEGSKVGPDGSLTIPAARVQEVKTLLGRGIHHERHWRQERQALQEQVEQARQEGAYEVERAKQVLDELERRVEEFTAGVDAEGMAQLKALADQYPRSGLLTFLSQLTVEWPALKLQAKEKAFEQERKQLLAGRSTEQRAEQVQQLDAALDVHVSEVAAQYPDVPAARVLQKLKRHGAARYFFRADRDVTDDQGQLVLRKGEIGVRMDLIADEFADYQQVAQEARQREAAARETEKANAAATARSRAPAAVPAGGAPVPGAKEPAIPKFKSKAERDAWLHDRKQRHADLGIAD